MKRPTNGPSRHLNPRSALVAVALLVLVFFAFTYHLSSVLISDMDEGTYVCAGGLVARGLMPYRDFMLAHPPLIAFVVAGWDGLFGSALVPLRLGYVAIILASTLPLYLTVRRVAALDFAPLLSIVLYTSGMLLLANMGRTVRLEPLMNAFVTAGVACRFLRPGSRAWGAAAGALFACALLVKVVAVIPLGLLLLSDIAFDRPWRDVGARWAFVALGALGVLVPAIGWCVSQPQFVHDVFVGQLRRPGIGLATRLHYLGQNIERFPPVLLGLVAGLFFLVRRGDPGVRSLAAVAVGSTFALVLGFKTFFNYYIVQALPWLAAVFAIALDRAMVRALGRRWGPAAYASIAVLGLAIPIAYAKVYESRGSFHVAGPRNILPLLRDGKGYVYSMYPAFALWTGRDLYPWYYRVDSLVARINGWVGDLDFEHVFEGSQALVLFTGEMDPYPLARHYVESHFARAYRDADWSVWIRTGE